MKKAAANIIGFPFRVLVFILNLAGRLVAACVLLGVLFVVGAGVYFYTVKSYQPMVIDPQFSKSLPPEGMTFRELWQDRFAGWAVIDERDYRTGKSESKSHCATTQKQLFLLDQVAIPFGRIFFSRFAPDTSTGQAAIRGMDGIIAPPDLNIWDAWWWQIENETWWYWVDHQAICKLPPPQRPTTMP